jgi:ornithine cyclodeaminase
MREAFSTLSGGEVDVPLRTALSTEKGTVLYKPAFSGSAGIFAAKIVSVFPGNAAKGLEVCPGVILVNSADTGMPVAMVEAGYLTSLRTGAATGLATDLLAGPNARTAALFGTGGQARHQLEAMLEVRRFETVHVFSRNPDHSERFCEENRDLALNCQLVANSNRDVIKQCDVITTVTTSATPVVFANELSSVCHINAVGSLGKDRTELDAETLLSSRIVVDQREACLAEAGEICLLRDDGRLPDDFAPAEIGELVNSKEHPGSGRTVFKSVGNAIQDLVCVAELLRIIDDPDSISL